MDSSATSIFLVSHTHFMQFRKSDRKNSLLQGNKFRYFFSFLHMFQKGSIKDNFDRYESPEMVGFTCQALHFNSGTMH